MPERDPHAATMIQETSPVSDVIAPTKNLGNTRIAGNVLIPLNNIASIGGQYVRRRNIDEFERVRRMSVGASCLTAQFPYGLTNLKVPVAGDEAFTPLPLPVTSKPLEPFMTPSFE